MVSRRVTSLLVAALILLLPQAASAVVAPTKVYDPPGNEWFPFRNASYLAYEGTSTTHPRHGNAYARDLTSSTNQKLNAKGTEGDPGGFDPGTNTVIFQEWSDGSAIRMFDLDSQTSVPVPGVVNSPKWEWEPRISTAYISFFRNTKVNGVWYADLYLYDRASTDLTKMARMPSAHYNVNGTVGEQYATWSSCDRKTCHAYLYDATTATKTTIPTRNGRPQYAPAVDEVHGTLFFVRSGFGCGVSVIFYKVPVANPATAPTKVAQLPDGVDVDTASLDGPDLLFSRIACGKSSGIYELGNVAA